MSYNFLSAFHYAIIVTTLSEEKKICWSKYNFLHAVLNKINKYNNRQTNKERKEKINATNIQTDVKTILDKELKPKHIETPSTFLTLSLYSL